MAVYTSYDVVGAKEDVSDIITNISPTKTPFLSSIGKEKVHNKVFHWLEDSLAAVTNNKQVEGFTPTSATITPRVDRSNYTQILQKTVEISATNEASDHYGVDSELANELAKAAAELKRDLEHALVGTAQVAAAGSTSVARATAGVQAQIAAGNTTAVGGALTESAYLGMLQDVYDAGGEPTTTLIKPADALIFANFAGASGRERDFGSETKIVNVVNIYVSPFGEQKVVLDRFINTANLISYDPSDWKLAVLRDWTKEPLAKVGDAQKVMLVGEFGLKHSNQLASGMLSTLS